jgi:hypothetical protein
VRLIWNSRLCPRLVIGYTQISLVCRRLWHMTCHLLAVRICCGGFSLSTGFIHNEIILSKSMFLVFTSWWYFQDRSWNWQHCLHVANKLAIKNFWPSSNFTRQSTILKSVRYTRMYAYIAKRLGSIRVYGVREVKPNVIYGSVVGRNEWPVSPSDWLSSRAKMLSQCPLDKRMVGS